MNRELFNKQIKEVREELIEYTCRKIYRNNINKLGMIYLLYAIIIQAIHDKHFGKDRDKASAELYFNSDGFIYDCEILCIKPSLMLYIVNNIDKYDLRDYDYGFDF